MPRIRTIKPGFFTSEDVSALPMRARLTWIGLWTHCDDQGRAKDNGKLIKAAVWPLDDVSLRDIEEDLATLADHGRIVRYEVDGRRYLAVTNWGHQRINRPTDSTIPAPPGDTTRPLRDDSVRTHGGLTPGGEGKGKEGRGERARPRATPTPAFASKPRCPRHAGLPDDDPGPNCVACRDRRIAAEKADEPVRIAPPPWCGKCDQATRQRERDDGRMERCPDCHPLREAGEP